MISNLAEIAIKATNPHKTLTGVPLNEFLSMEIPPSQFILAPWLTTNSLNMLHAKRGVGKSHVGLAIAYAVATGTGFLKWNAPLPRKVVYIDGEMSAHTVQSRMKAISNSNPKDQTLLSNLRIFTPDLHEGPIPDLSQRSWHLSVREFISNAELVIVDNLSCLARSGGSENESESWSALADWALELRRNDISVLFIHHSGKGGQQRGTSRKEDILNVVLNLKHPANYTADMGAYFEVHFEKGRELIGDAAKSFEARLECSEDIYQWSITDLEDSLFNQVVKMALLGMRYSDIAIELEINKSTVSRHLKRAREEGLIKGKQEE